MSIKLSIIVPVYNVEEYVEQCILSLVDIPIQEKEIIVVNDGSTDKSIEKIQYLNLDGVKIVNQKNGGLSSARNTGLKNANGEYVIFIDSDDYIINSIKIKEMIDIGNWNNADVIIGNGYVFFDELKKIKIYNKLQDISNKVITGKDFLKETLNKKNFNAMVWLNIYRRSFLSNNNFLFKEGVYHEDIEWTIKVMLVAKNVVYLDALFYMYRQREGSIMRARDYTKHSKDMIDICINNIKLIDKENDNSLKNLINDEMLDTIFWAIMRAQKTNKNFIKEQCINKIPQNKANRNITKLKYSILKVNKSLAFWLNELYEKYKKAK